MLSLWCWLIIHANLPIMDTLYVQQNIWNGIIPKLTLLYWPFIMYEFQPNLNADSHNQEYHPHCFNKFSIGSGQ